MATAPLSANVSVDFEVIARSDSTVVPGESETFRGFGVYPAIDADGNVVFIGGSLNQAGVYTAMAGACCQTVADYDTPIPGGGGATFEDFNGIERPDIDGGRVAFKALIGPLLTGLYSNAGQSNAGSLQEVAVLDGVEWGALGDPWVDGDEVGVYGEQLQPSSQYAIMRWNGASGAVDFVDPGTGYNVAYETQASLSGAASILGRAKVGSYQIGIAYDGGGFETLAEAGVTEMPGLPGVKFSKFYPYPVVDFAGEDVAFLGYGDQKQGLFKRVAGGVLQNVADNTTPVPGAGGDIFKIIAESGIALANGQVVFWGQGQYTLKGIYTDIGGELSVLVDNEINNFIDVGGETLQVTGLSLSTRSFAYTPDGYMVVFHAYLAGGDSAIIRATISDGAPPFDRIFKAGFEP